MMESPFHFIRPAWLLLSPLAVGLWWLWRQGDDPLRGWRAQMHPDLLRALVTGNDSHRRRAAYWPLVGWLLAIVAVAGPTWRPEPDPFARDSAPLLVLLKADASMETDDVAPSRLERAHLKIADLAVARKGQALGLIAYSGSAHLVLPATKDTDAVAQMAAEISPQIMPEPGDRLDLALAMAGRLLADGSEEGSILVVADTVDTDLQAVAEAHQRAGAPHVRFLGVNRPASSEDESVREAARALGAAVDPLAVDSADIDQIVHDAARPRGFRGGGRDAGQVQWEEAGWWLVPVLALLVAFSFRRETAKEGVS